MTEAYVFEAERRDLASVAREMFNRKNTNVAGGNISVKITAPRDINYGSDQEASRLLNHDTNLYV